MRYFTTAGTALVAPAIAALRREQPRIAVELKLSDPDDPMPEVRDRQADIALVVRPAGQLGVDGVRFVHLLDDRYDAVLPVAHRLAAKPVLELTDLADEPWVASESPGPCLDPILEACGSAGYSPDFVVESGDYATAQGFVAAGLGVSLVPRLGLDGPHSEVVVREVRNPVPVRSIYAAVRGAAPESPALRGLLDALRGAVAQLGSGAGAA